MPVQATIAITPGSGQFLDAVSLVIGGNTVVRETMVLADPSNATQLANITAAGALQVDGSAVTQPVSISGTVPISGTITANQGSAAALSGKWPVQITDGTNTMPTGDAAARTIHVTIDNASVTVAGTITANQGGTWNVRAQDGSGTALTSTGSALDINLKTSSITLPVSIAAAIDVSDRAARLVGVVYGSQGQQLKQTATNFNLQTELATGGTLYDARQIRALTSADVVSAAQSGTWNVRAQDGSGNALTTNSTTPTGKFALDQNIVSILGTAPTTAGFLDIKGADGNVFVRQATAANLNATVVGTVTANIGTTNGLALDTSVNGLLLTQGSTTSGQKGPLIQGAVTTNAPGYTTTQTSPLSLDTSGLLRVSIKDTPSNTNNFNVNLAASAATVTVTGTITANQGGAPWSQNLTQVASTSLGATAVTNFGTAPAAAAVPGVNASIYAGTTGLTATGSSLNANITNTVSITANSSVNVAQFGGNNVVTGTGASGVGIPRVTISNDSALNQTIGVAGFEKITDGTNTAAVKAASTPAAATDPSLVVALSPNSSLPAGTNVIGALVANQSVAPTSSGTTGTAAPSTASETGVVDSQGILRAAAGCAIGPQTVIQTQESGQMLDILRAMLAELRGIRLAMTAIATDGGRYKDSDFAPVPDNQAIDPNVN